MPRRAAAANAATIADGLRAAAPTGQTTTSTVTAISAAFPSSPMSAVEVKEEDQRRDDQRDGHEEPRDLLDQELARALGPLRLADELGHLADRRVARRRA